mmetsp:Transcript_77/g.279  ORF Transcript_77/g.279 Transcript_77/m.279 type:complete len:215 (-) Transcript_77:510-1154(-)
MARMYELLAAEENPHGLPLVVRHPLDDFADALLRFFVEGQQRFMLRSHLAIDGVGELLERLNLLVDDGVVGLHEGPVELSPRRAQPGDGLVQAVALVLGHVHLAVVPAPVPHREAHVRQEHHAQPPRRFLVPRVASAGRNELDAVLLFLREGNARHEHTREHGEQCDTEHGANRSDDAPEETDGCVLTVPDRRAGDVGEPQAVPEAAESPVITR